MRLEEGDGDDEDENDEDEDRMYGGHMSFGGNNDSDDEERYSGQSDFEEHLRSMVEGSDEEEDTDDDEDEDEDAVPGLISMAEDEECDENDAVQLNPSIP